MARLRRWTDDQLVECVLKSRSNRQLMISLGLNATGGSAVEHVYRSIKRLDISTAHFAGSAWSKGKKTPRGPVKGFLERLVRDGRYSNNSRIRSGLISNGYKENRCECCGISEWNGEPAPLELDHKNGDRHDYQLENLQILCANCHALKTRVDIQLKCGPLSRGSRRVCPECGVSIMAKSPRCRKCSGKATHKDKIVWPDHLILVQAKRERKIASLARELGISDTAIHKRIRMYLEKVRESTGGMVCHQS